MAEEESTPLAAFLKAKAAFEENARNVTSTEGIIDDAVSLESILVGLF